MAGEERTRGAEASGGGGGDPALGLATGGASRGEADLYLRKQRELLDLQIEDLKREDTLRHWSLRVRHISDVMKLTFELGIALIVMALVALIGTTMWEASHDNSLVIEAFSVPADLAARGITGEAVAAKLQDRLTAMQAETDSARPAASYANNWGSDIRVQIPDTGVSVGEFYRMLAAWFGHQTHITGEICRTPAGLGVTVRASGDPGDTVEGSERDLDALMQKASEAVYARTQEFRYAVYLVSHQPVDAARSDWILETLANSGSLRDRIWADMAIGTHAEFADPAQAPAIQAEAIPLAPRFSLAFNNIGSEEQSLGHDEAALAALRKGTALLAAGDDEMSARASAVSLPANRAIVAMLTGDYGEAQRRDMEAALLPDYAHIADFARWSMADNRALLHETGAARDAWNGIAVPPVRIGIVNHDLFDIRLHFDLEDWAAVLDRTARFEKYLEDGQNIPPFSPAYAPFTLARRVWPYAAAARAHGGDMKGALALIAKTPLDCDVCVRMRGNIAALGRDWNGAAHWFAMVSARAPSIPFADTDWGAMLLSSGQYDAAIAKLASAHEQSPRFADPLELWGEALIAKNRSDLALAKFEDAAKLAPRWGRLHLKWGEALLWSGDRDGARKQFALAAGPDLTAAERAQLAAVQSVRAARPARGLE